MLTSDVPSSSGKDAVVTPLGHCFDPGLGRNLICDFHVLKIRGPPASSSRIRVKNIYISVGHGLLCF